MPTIALTIVDQTVAVTQVGEIGPTGATGATGATGSISGAPDGTVSAPGIPFASDIDTGIFHPGADILGVATGGVERGRFSSSGATFDTQIEATSAGDAIIKNTVANVGTAGADDLALWQSFLTGLRANYMWSNSNYLFGLASNNGSALTTEAAAIAASKLVMDNNGHVTPGVDNTQNFGSGAFRWGTIYAGTGTINTSDERYKVIREGGDLTDAEYAAWSAVRTVVYRDKDSFDRKGDAARLHVGYSWQGIQAAFEAQGLDPAKYGLWCEDELLAPVEKTRTAQRQIEGQTETIPVLDEAGEPVFEQVQATEEVEQPFEEVRIFDGAPVLVNGVRTVAQPVFDSVQVKDEAGELLFEIVQERDAETGELVEAVPVPRMAPVPRMVSKSKTETVPVMEDYEEAYSEMEPTGETRGALRYQECGVLEAAWLRRELAQLSARVATLETP